MQDQEWKNELNREARRILASEGFELQRTNNEDDDEENEDQDDDDDDDDADGENDEREEEEGDDDGIDGEEGDEEENDNENEDGTEENSHLNELRRQAMIESLIGMGFPVDWALRAAEHCDVSTSESAAISWIIERMELEQSKMDDMEGDSRFVKLNLILCLKIKIYCCLKSRCG